MEVSKTKKKEAGAEGKVAGVSPTSGLIQTLEGGVLTKRSSRIASRKDMGEGQQESQCVLCCVVARVCVLS